MSSRCPRGGGTEVEEGYTLGSRLESEQCIVYLNLLQ